MKVDDGIFGMKRWEGIDDFWGGYWRGNDNRYGRYWWLWSPLSFGLHKKLKYTGNDGLDNGTNWESWNQTTLLSLCVNIKWSIWNAFCEICDFIVGKAIVIPHPRILRSCCLKYTWILYAHASENGSWQKARKKMKDEIVQWFEYEKLFKFGMHREIFCLLNNTLNYTWYAPVNSCRLFSSWWVYVKC